MRHGKLSIQQHAMRSMPTVDTQAFSVARNPHSIPWVYRPLYCDYVLFSDLQVYVPSGEVAPLIIYEYYSVGPSGTSGGRGPLLSFTSLIDWVYGEFTPCTDTCATGGLTFTFHT